MKLKLCKVIFWIILIAVVFFPTLSKIQKLRQREKELARKVDSLRVENQKLSEENRMLKTDPVYIEEVAREKLKVARKNEIVYRVIEEKETEK